MLEGAAAVADLATNSCGPKRQMEAAGGGGGTTGEEKAVVSAEAKPVPLPRRRLLPASDCCQ